MVAMKIFGLALDEQSQVPLLILKNQEETKVLPIWIGAMEAMSISVSLNKVSISRPLTHDLMLQTLETLGAEITSVVVVDLREGTYYAELHLKQQDRTYLVDSRPSDAIALAVRRDIPVYANEDLLERMDKQFEEQSEAVLKDEESDKWTEMLQNVDVDDFKYKM
ncbi:MAG: bifunctional nuclease family protein [Desulfohalobiaceae bacterium]|nr:bifunctional nuclease family protein [Desulfohalobiaceae bacterium]